MKGGMPSRGDWRVRGKYGEVEIELHPNAPPDPGERDASMRHLEGLVYDFKNRDPEARRVALDIFARLQGLTSGALGSQGFDLDTGSSRAGSIGDAIMRAGQAGNLVLRRRATRSVVIPLEGVAEEAPLGPEAEPTAWIAIELVDDEGNPVPDAAYRVVCSDGRVRTGTTNMDGKAREDGLVDGNCKVFFPALNPPDWKKVG
jgi:hypothetical protein